MIDAHGNPLWAQINRKVPAQTDLCGFARAVDISPSRCPLTRPHLRGNNRNLAARRTDIRQKGLCHKERAGDVYRKGLGPKLWRKAAINGLSLIQVNTRVQHQ